MKTCLNCINLRKGKEFKHPRHKKISCFYVCEKRRRLITMAYNGSQAQNCIHYEELK